MPPEPTERTRDADPLKDSAPENSDVGVQTDRNARPDQRPQGMLPARERRRTAVERGFMRLVATAGIIGVAVALGAILVSQDVAGWIGGLVIGVISVVLAALLWSSRQL
jgi:hypothetical protein